MTDFDNSRRDEGTNPPPPPPPPGQYGYGAPGNQWPPGQGGYGGPTAPPPNVAEAAGVGPRFLARLVDFLILGVVSGIIGSTLVVGMMMNSNASMMSEYGIGRSTSNAANAVTSVISAVIALAYFTLMEANRGQTLGKMLFRLHTRGPGGGHPTMQEALKRNAFTAIPILGVIPFLGGLAGLLSLIAMVSIAVTINRNTATRQGWHDDFAGGTTVVRMS